MALDSTRTSNGYGYGANPLSYTDILSYFTLMDEKPEPHEVRLITRIDREILSVYAEQVDKELKKNNKG